MTIANKLTELQDINVMSYVYCSNAFEIIEMLATYALYLLCRAGIGRLARMHIWVCSYAAAFGGYAGLNDNELDNEQ